MATQRQYFQQDPPRLGNQYLEDTGVKELLQRVVPRNVLSEIESDLTRFGDRVVTDIWQLGKEAELPTNEPQVKHHSPWGERIDDLIVCDAWNRLKDIAAEEGLVAIGYERKHGKYSRLHQFVKLYMFHSSSAIYTCPLAMTDGAARLTEVLLKNSTDVKPLQEHLQERFKHLTSRDPKQFWTSGQWMTERTGGSDVGGTETIAVHAPHGGSHDYLLHGYKFFTSATTSETAYALARIQDESGKAPQGSGGLSLFQIDTRNQQGKLNNIIIHRLKDKLGTRAVPTAELELIGTPAKLVSKPGKGVGTIATLFNLTRIYNACCGVSGMRRVVALARDYAHRRTAFGHTLSQQPLHLQTLSRMEIMLRACQHFIFHEVLLLGELECEPNERADNLLRLLTPLGKLWIGKLSISVISEGVESFGGIGYMEDSHIPVLLRDAQVESIWEGTTNVLSLDVLRALGRSPKAFKFFNEAITKRVAQPPQQLSQAASIVSAHLQNLTAYITSLPSLNPVAVQAGARDLALSLASTYAGSLLIEHAIHTGNKTDEVVAHRWCESHISSLKHAPTASDIDVDRLIALDMDKQGHARGSGNTDAAGRPRAKY